MAWSELHTFPHVWQTIHTRICSSSTGIAQPFSDIQLHVCSIPQAQILPHKVYMISWNAVISKIGGIMYYMVVHIFDIDHGFTLLAFTNVPTAVCFMKVYFVCGELFVAIAAWLRLVFCGHFQILTNIGKQSIIITEKSYI